MKFTMDDFLMNSFCMAKDESEHVRFGRRMKAAGFDRIPRLYRGNYPKVLFNEGKTDVDVYYCALNHYVLVNMALTLDLPFITVFESDAFPMKSCRDELSMFFDEHGVPDDADELTFGNINFIRDYSGKFGLKDVRDGYGRIKGDLWGTHAAIYFRRGYEKWLKSYLDRKDQIGPDFYNWLVPNAYSSERSFFIQWKEELQYPTYLLDPQNLSDFPDGKLI